MKYRRFVPTESLVMLTQIFIDIQNDMPRLGALETFTMWLAHTGAGTWKQTHTKTNSRHEKRFLEFESFLL